MSESAAAAGGPVGGLVGEVAGGPVGEVAAVVGGEPVWAAEVAAELARLRAGPVGGRLPPDGTAEGRQLRRWTAQRVVLRRLLEREAAARGLGGDPNPAARPDPEPRPDPALRPDHAARPDAGLRPDPALLGAAVADVLTTSPAARAVYAAVTATVTVPEPAGRAYYDRNADRFTRLPSWLVRQATAADPADLAGLLAAASPVPVHPDSLPAAVRQAAADAGPRTGTALGPVRGATGWHLVRVDAVTPGGLLPYPEVRDRIAADLLARRRQQAFARWLDARAAALVRLRPGYEHPADPRNPDATHRH